MASSDTWFKKGHSNSIEFRKKSSIRCKLNPPHLGKKHSETTIKKISNSRKGKAMGEKNGFWKGGINKISDSIRVMPEYIEWRSSIFERDNWTCKTCNKNGVVINAHHIKPFIQIIKDNNISSIIEARNCPELWNKNNGVTLCEECHKLTYHYKGRGKQKL